MTFPGVDAPRRRLALSLSAWLVLVVAEVAILGPLRSDDRVGAIALLMLLPPLAVTGHGPFVAAGAALATGLVFNFVFTHPYDSPSIESNASVAALGVYVVVATALAVLASRVRAARSLADRRAADATLLQSLTVDLIRNEQIEATLEQALDELATSLQLRGATLVTSDGEVQVAAGTASRKRLAAADGHDREFQIRVRDRILGLVDVTVDDPLGPDQERILEAFCGITALALERSRLAEEGVRRRAAEEADRLRSQLLQSVSHDLRTPLTAIKTSSDACLDPAIDPARRAQLLLDVGRQADRLAKLVSDLLDLSRISAGALHLRLAPVPVDELVDDAVDAARSSIGGAEVDIRIPEDLGDLEVDETMIRQVLVNLLANAARHGPSGRPIEVRAGRDGRQILVSVADHGNGIAESEKHLVFEAYQRSRPGSPTVGVGVGLAIARGFVEAHGGSIGIEDTPGGGATVIVRLPAGDAA